MYVHKRTHIHIEKINIGITDVESVIRSLKNGRMCRLEDICAKLLKDGTEKLYRILSNIIKQCLNDILWTNEKWRISLQYIKNDPRRIQIITEEFRCQVQ